MPKINNIEIIQAIQAYQPASGGEIPLLIGKNTLVRVYLGGVGNPSGSASDIIEGALKLTLVNVSDKPVTCIDSCVRLLWGAGSSEDPVVQREDLDRTLNFQFEPGDLFDQAALKNLSQAKLRIEVEALFVNGQRASISGTKVVNAKFSVEPTLKVHMLGLRYHDQEQTVYFPDAQHFANSSQSIENLYPITQLNLSHVVVDADPEFTLPFADVDEFEPDWEWYYKLSLVHAQLLAHRTLDLDANPDSMLSTWYYAMVDYPDYDFFRGAASGVQLKNVEEEGIAANFDIVSCGPVEEPGGLYAAHEIAHCLDLHHSGIGDQARVDPHYPNTGGYISVDRYPEVIPFDSPATIGRAEADKLWGRYTSEKGLANNHTLGLIIERYRKNQYQGQGKDAGLTQLRSDLEQWKKAADEFGAEHLGLRTRDWQQDRELLSYRDHYDFMGYLQPKWVSSYSYLQLLKNIQAYQEQQKRPKFNQRREPGNICIIGLYNNILGTGIIKYVFKTHEMPGTHVDTDDSAIRLRFDDYPVDPAYIQYKFGKDDRLGDPVFLGAGIFKCVVSEKNCFGPDHADVNLHEREKLYLDIAQTVSAAGAAPEPSYLNIDRKLLKRAADSPLCNCNQQPFNILRTSPEPETSDILLKLVGDGTSSCSYIARARFFDLNRYKTTHQTGLTNWTTLGVNFRSAHSLYLDKNHCMLPGSWLDDIRDFLFEGSELMQPFRKIYEVKNRIEQREGRPFDICAFAVELTCLAPRDPDDKDTRASLFQSRQLFHGMVIEKLDKPGEFYFIDFTDRRYQRIKKIFEAPS
jgi:hypothetical protein